MRQEIYYDSVLQWGWVLVVAKLTSFIPTHVIKRI